MKPFRAQICGVRRQRQSDVAYTEFFASKVQGTWYKQ